MCLTKDLKGMRKSPKWFMFSLFSCSPLRPDDSAVWVDQQEWGAAGQKSVPPGHGAGGLGHPGALPGRAGCAVSSLIISRFAVIRCRWHQSKLFLDLKWSVWMFLLSCLTSCSVLSSLVFPLALPSLCPLLLLQSFLNFLKRFCYCLLWRSYRTFCDELGSVEQSGGALEKDR